MLEIAIDETTYAVKFSRDPLMAAGSANARTQCSISARGETVCLGISCCHPSDRNDHNIGRKLALRRALDGFPKKADRAMVWAAYFDKRHGKK